MLFAAQITNNKLYCYVGARTYMKHIYAFRNHLVKDNTDFSVTQNCFYFHLEMLRYNINRSEIK